MDLDFDFDLDNDNKINRFLQNKLEEIKAKNEKLLLTLHERRQFLRDQTERSSSEMDEADVIIHPEVWKKVFNDKYVLGLMIENNGTSCLHNLKAVLKWDSHLALSYQVFLYEESSVPFLKTLTSPTFICTQENCCGLTNSLKKSNKVNKTAHLVVTLQRPKFIDGISYNITGNLIFQQDERSLTLIFPEVEVSAYDATNHQLHNHSLPGGDVKDIIMAASCSAETKLVMVFSRDWSNSFDSTFEILCSFTKVNSPTGCRKMFVAHRLSPLFDDSLLVFHAPKEANAHIFNFTVYSKNEDSLLSLLHHVHQNIPGVMIIPETLYENYILQHPELISVDTETSKLADCLKKEINHVENFLRESESDNDPDKNHFRQELADMQLNTDTHYLRLLKAVGETTAVDCD